MNLKFKKVIGTVVVYAVLLVFLIVALFPIYWMFVTSIKENSEMYNLVPTFWPTQVTGVHYQALFTKYKFQDAVLNSIIVSTVVAVSYTHLDVYKRQSFSAVITPGDEIKWQKK